MVQPGGLIFAAAISRFASLFDGLARGFLFEPGFRAIVDRDLREGQHRNPTDRPDWFTTAYLHHPDELRDEAAESGLGSSRSWASRGWRDGCPIWRNASTPTRTATSIMFSARAVESEPALLGLSAHLILVARTPFTVGPSGAGTKADRRG